MSKEATGDGPAGQREHDATARSLNRLDPILQHRSRFGACVLLSTADALSFSRLRELLDETDGNLGAQLRRLEDVGYLAVKYFIRFLAKQSLDVFAWYRLALAGGVVVWLAVAAS